MRHLYVHVPFCVRRCVYCDFSIAVRKAVPATRYVEAIRTEHALRIDRGEWDAVPLETLYFGGGTPSQLSSEKLADLLRHFLEAEAASPVATEVTVEANPEDVTEDVVRTWVAAGVNRVSLGVQSFDARVLRWMHRNHLPDHAAAAVQALRVSGIESVSLDLIAALPPRIERDFEQDLSQALELEPDHVSVYGLSVEPQTALARWVARGAAVPASDTEYGRDFLLAHELLTGAGYEHYEVSNYAKAGRRSRHNCAYWDGSPYAGLGPSAHGFDGAQRRWNVAPWARYESVVTGGGDPTEGRETLTPAQVQLERVYLGLRVSDGLSAAETGMLNRALLHEAERQGWGFSEAGRWRLTPLGWLRLDELVTALTTSAEGG
jgi:oxygen-independent coproporphyrinogen-3 oxidase